MTRWMMLGVALAAGCAGDRMSATFTVDTRIDGASDENDPDSFGTRMCVTESGAGAAVYVIWLDDRDNGDGRMDIWMNRSLDLGETWLDVPVKVNAGSPDVESNLWNPDLFCNELGVFVVWEDDRDGVLQNHQVYFNRSIDQGQTFAEEDVVLENDPDGMSMSLEPKITGYGENLFVTWYDSLNGAYDILLASSSNGGAQWRPPARVDKDNPAGSAYSARPEVAVSENGQDVWVVWEDSRDGFSDIYFNRSDNGGTTWKEDERLDKSVDDLAGETNSFEPNICTDGEGQLYAVWHDERNGSGRDIYFNYSADKGDNWLVATQRLEGEASPPGFGNSLFPVCVSDGSTAHVAWYDQLIVEKGYDILYAKIDSGIPAGDPIRLDQGWPDPGEPEGYANSVDPRIALGADTVAVAWSDYRGEATAQEPSGYNDLYYNFSEDGGASFQDTDLRIDSMYTGTSFKKDLNFEILGGSWFAAWTDGRGGTQDIYFESMAIGEQADPPSLEDAQQSQ